MRKITLIILTFVLCANTYAQSAYSGSSITNEAYLDDPVKYLSKLDTSKIKSQVLIDRTLFGGAILKVNGTNLVTTISTFDWRRMYFDLKLANYDNSFLPDMTEFSKEVQAFGRWKNAFPIGILHFDFKQIPSSGLANGTFIQAPDYLQGNNVTPNSYLSQKAFAASCLDDNIYGDKVNFIIPSWLYITNTNQKIQSIQVDFGNGEGFKSVTLDEIINVSYRSVVENIEIVVKVNLTNAPSGQSTLYSHSTILRKGTSVVPKPSPIIGPINHNGGSAAEPTFTKYYPVGNDSLKLTCYSYLLASPHCFHNKPITVEKLEYTFLFNPKNTSGKLRRPFIVCDGFDYEDQRNYYHKNSSWIGSLTALPMEKDIRGLYEMANGSMSPWNIAKKEESGELIPALLNDGYDLVFVNFLDGAGDVFINANAMRGFLNDIINKEYRDNKTEEIILVGPSMGGLVTRMALTKMERAHEEHYVKMWIPFDSPHKGANIPLSLQHAIAYAAGLTPPVGWVFKGKLGAVNSPCAQQLLLFHHTQSNGSSNPTTNHYTLYDTLDALGYPKYSKNYGITNGGRNILYSSNAQKTVNFKLLKLTLDGWGNWNSDGSSTVFEGSSSDDKQKITTNTQIALDNSAGGWNTALYSLNFNSNNSRSDDNENNTDSIPINMACFIPTPSALGCVVSRTSVKSTWQEYTNVNDNASGKIKTPFDEIHGMETNEEHVRITPDSKDYVIQQFDNYIKNTVRPIVRSGQTLNQEIKGKVAYTVTETISFGNTGNGNSFTFNPGSDVNIVAGKTVDLLPGFGAKNGSEVHIKTQPIDIKTVLLGATPNSYKKENEKKQFDYTKPSAFLGKIYDYSEKTNVRMLSSSIEINVSPNPTSGEFNFTIAGLNGGNVKVEIYNAVGEMIISENVFSDGTYNANISAFESGVYLLKVIGDSGESNKKIVKL